jgi:DNA-binding transcriptional regulator YdaS (Cro superfamily)
MIDKKRVLDPGLEQAVKAAGGVRALARLLNITPNAVSHWDRILAERLLEIERVTGVLRELLRPELYRRPFIASDHPSVRNDKVTLALIDGVALLVLALHRGIPLESTRDELHDDTALGVIVNRVLEASKRANSHA